MIAENSTNNDIDTRSKRHKSVFEGLLLALVLLLAIFMAYIPHLDYIYPIHIDESSNTVTSCPSSSSLSTK